MIENEINLIWQNASAGEMVKLNRTLLLVEIEKEAQRTDQAFKRRDRREIIVAIALMPVLLLAAYFVPYTLSKIALLLLIPWCMFVIYCLRQVKKYKVDDASLPFLEYLEYRKVYLEKEKQLLQSVLYWYVLPPTILCILFFAGLPVSGARFAIHCVIVVGINLYICYLNQNAVKNELGPLISRIEQNISQLRN